jgi:hypothetical protein
LLSNKFLIHFIRCGKSDKNQRRRLSSTGCLQLTSSFVDLNWAHMAVFHVAPSVTTPSIRKPDLSVKIMHSSTIFAKTFPDALPLLKKQAKAWTHCPRNGWNMRTSAWSPKVLSCASVVKSPRSTNPCTLKTIIFGFQFMFIDSYVRVKGGNCLPNVIPTCIVAGSKDTLLDLIYKKSTWNQSIRLSLMFSKLPDSHRYSAIFTMAILLRH